MSFVTSRGSAVSYKGTVLLLTLMMLVLLTFEVAVISLVAQRGLGEEGMLGSRHIAARRGAEAVLNRLEEALYTYLSSNDTATAETAFAYGGTNDIDEQDLMIANPATGGAEATDIRISAWVESRRGLWFHLVGRAQTGGTDLMVHRWIRVNPCKSGSTLVQILPTNETKPGYYSLEVSPVDDRVFFGEDAGSGSFWTWHPDTGLSTLTQALETRPGVVNSAIASDGRIYFGEQAAGGRFWSWHESTGFSTLLPANEQSPGWYTTHISPVDDRVFFGENSGATLWTYKPATGLSTIGDVFYSPGDETYAFGADGTYYFGDWGGSAIYSWNPASGLSTVFYNAGVSGAGNGSLHIVPDGRLFFGQANTAGANRNFWTWKSGVLSTLLPTNSHTKAGYHYATGVAPNGRVMFSRYDDAGWTNGPLWTWHVSTGLSTIFTNIGALGIAEAVIANENSRFYFGHQSDWSPAWTWHEITGLSTMISGAWKPLASFAHALGDNDTVYFGQVDGNNAYVWRWKPGSGLTTIGDGGGQSCWGCDSGIAVNDKGRVYWSANRALTWQEGKGLSTMVTLNGANGYGSLKVTSDGGVYIGSDGTKPFYKWTPPGDCSMY